MFSQACCIDFERGQTYPKKSWQANSQIMKILIRGGCLDTCMYLHLYINIMKNFNSTVNFLIFNSIFYMLPKGRGRGNLFFSFCLIVCLFVCCCWLFFLILRYVRGWDFWLIHVYYFNVCL